MRFLLLTCLLAFAGVAFAQIAADKITEPLPGYNGPAMDFDEYAGYITVDESHGRALFYWFVESQNNPSTDPVVLWLNGGPGCSSLDGFFYEHGPYHYDRSVGGTNDGLRYNLWAWNHYANVIYLEAPAGVGFSYSNTTSDYVTNDNKTAEDNYTFLVNFFQNYSSFASHDFYIAGESYAGVYVPTLAYYVHTQNQNPNNPFINLKGILVGNGVTDEAYDSTSFPQFAYNHGLYSPNLYNELTENNCIPVGSYGAGGETCDKLLLDMYNTIGNINYYDVYRLCYSGPDLPEDYEEYNYHPLRDIPSNGFGTPRESVPCINSRAATNYLNNDTIREIVHAMPISAIGEWSICSDKVIYEKLYNDLIPVYQTLTQNYRVLVYSGDSDGAVPYVGTIGWIENLEEYTEPDTDWVAWNIQGQVAGYLTTYSKPYPLTFTTVKGSGHMVPQFAPVVAASFFANFMKGNFPPQ